MKTKLLTAGLVLSMAVSVVLLGKIAWDKYQLDNVNTQLNTQLMKANLEIGRAKTKFGVAQNELKNLSDTLQEEMKIRNALITRYGELEIEYEVLKEFKGKGEIVYVDKPVKPGEFEIGMLYSALDSNTLVPAMYIGANYKDFRIDAMCRFLPEPNTTDTVPFQFMYNLHIKYKGQLVETRTPSGAINHYFNMWELDDKGKRINQLTLKNFEVIVDDQTKAHWHWLALHLDAGSLLGISSDIELAFGGSVGISFMGYGRTKNDLSWRFARLSVDFTKTLGVGITPVQYNLGELLPVISNLWIGPHFSYMIDKRWMVGLAIGSVL